MSVTEFLDLFMLILFQILRHGNIYITDVYNSSY